MAPVEIQVVMFLIMGLTGVAIGLSHDLLRLPASLSPRLRRLQVAADVFFWLGATILVAAGFLLSSWGQVRLFHLLGIACGLWAYRTAASPFLCALLMALLSRVLRGCSRLLSILFRPIRWLLSPLRAPARRFRWALRDLRRKGRAWLSHLRGFF